MHAWNKFMRAWSLSQLGPAHPHGPSWAQP
jgi:hypothetical protein